MKSDYTIRQEKYRELSIIDDKELINRITRLIQINKRHILTEIALDIVLNYEDRMFLTRKERDVLDLYYIKLYGEDSE